MKKDRPNVFLRVLNLVGILYFPLDCNSFIEFVLWVSVVFENMAQKIRKSKCTRNHSKMYIS